MKKNLLLWTPALKAGCSSPGSYLEGLVWIASLVFLLGGIGAGCGKKEEPAPKPAPQAEKTTRPTLSPPAKSGATLYLAQAQFTRVKGEDGKERPAPGAARLVMFRKNQDRWQEEVLEDPESNVFHKALWFHPAEGAPGILTIGAVQAQLKLWRKTDGQWKAESLWNPTFGGQYDRLRDMEVGDVTGDGIDDIVIATHDQGVVAVVSWKDGKYQAEELTREKDTFVHEIELGDVDGDGKIEIFSTPSHPNKMDGSVQPGAIDMWKYQGGTWAHTRVDTLESRHAKEILCVTLNGESRAVLFASLEGERIGANVQGGDTTRIRLYRFEGGKVQSTDIVGLPGKLCRFLTYGDTDGDGRKEMIAFTKSSGIWKIEPGENPAGEWKKTLIATGSSGFEHSAYLADLNGDGKEEIYVASDDQKEMRCYWHAGTGYIYEVIGALKPSTITWNVTATLEEN